MKNHNPAGGTGLRFATARQRAFTVALFVVFVGLILAAKSGRYDRQVNSVAHSLDAGYAHIVGAVRRTFRKH